MLFILKQLINFQFQFSSLNIFHHFPSFFIKWYADLKKKYLDEFDLKAIIAVDLALHYCLLWSYEYGSRNNLSYLGKRIDLLSNIPSRKDTKPRSLFSLQRGYKFLNSIKLSLFFLWINVILTWYMFV